MLSAFLLQTLGPIVLGLLFTFSGLLDANPRWLGRLAFLVAQLTMIYMAGFGTVAGLGLVACSLIGFAVCAGSSNRPMISRVTGAAVFFGIYVAYWILQKYAVPLLIVPAAAANQPPFGAIQGVATAIAIVGISYIGFKFIHFFIDFRAGDIEHVDVLSFLSWLLFFPSIVAGPMQRYQDWESQFGHRKLTFDESVWALRRVLLGLVLKVGIADNIHSLTLPAMSEGTLATAPGWAIVVGALVYSFYLYFDFSGYCHIAIGTGMFWGIRLPENFNNPYIARNLAEFWNRWHITLSEILRDYLYYPMSLALKRSKRFRSYPRVATALPLVVTFLIAGVWHGAGITYLVYGLIHGVGLAYVALTRGQRSVESSKEPHRGMLLVKRWSAICFTFAYVSLSFVFFSLSSEKIGIIFRRVF